MAVAAQTNEITVAPQLIGSLDLSGCIITGDALLAQQRICTAIQEASGHYVLSGKANLATLRLILATLANLSTDDFAKVLPFFC